MQNSDSVRALDLSGGCLCGQVRYQCSAVPLFMVNCHCEHCRRTTGSGYAPIVEVPIETLAVSGSVTWYRVTSDRGSLVSRAFCPTCGSTLFGKIDGMDHMQIIHVGTLDDSSGFVPQFNLWTRDLPHWDVLDPLVERLDTQPPVDSIVQS
jgi:hypothetical protein